VAWTGSQLVAVGGGNYPTYSGVIVTSPDGVTWTNRSPASKPEFHGVVWAGSQAVVVGLEGNVLTSPDGITWTSRKPGTVSELQTVVWTGNQLVVAGENGLILTSPDGIGWTSTGLGQQYNLRGIAWTGAQIVAVGPGKMIFTSPDGSNWTSRNLGQYLFMNSVTWAGDQVVAVGNYGTILTSPKDLPTALLPSVTGGDLSVRVSRSTLLISVPERLRDQSARISVIYLTGQKALAGGVMNMKRSEGSLSIEALSPGAYLLELKTDEKRYCRPFMVIRP